MSSYRQIFYQIVFSTKHREPTLNMEHDATLYKYMWGIIQNKNCHLYQINGIEDHIHIVTDLHPYICLADLVKDIKVASSIWLKGCGLFPNFTSWQLGYAAFTYSNREIYKIINYVKKQKAHHKKEDFVTEYKRTLLEEGVDFEEKYLL